MTNAAGEVTLTASYTPWGDVLSVAGEDAFTFGYFGSMMDAATGLLYIGNGQYYDPETGRFINGGNQLNNLPVMVDPAGMFLAPLSLLPLVLGKKKKRSKWELLLIVLVMCVSLGISLTACVPGDETPTPTPTDTPQPPSNDNEDSAETDSGSTATATSTSTQLPTITCTFTPTPMRVTEDAINNTIQELVEFVFNEGNVIHSLSSYANIDATKLYLRRLMDEVSYQNKNGDLDRYLNTNHLAYIYATTHVESCWGDFVEKWDPRKASTEEEYFNNQYAPGTETGDFLGNEEPGDGNRYKGRGFIHLTGRRNYKVMGDLINKDLIGYPDRASYGLLSSPDYDYVTKIAVIGMAKGVFTQNSLFDYDETNGYNFYGARDIINPYDNINRIPAEKLGERYAEILFENCQLGGVSEGIICADPGVD